jgi:hypothetical protein
MIDIETRVAESMRARADAAPPTGNLHARVVRRAGAVRHRRRVVGGVASVCAAAAAVVAVVAAVAAVPFPADRGRAPESTADRTTTKSLPSRSPGPTTFPEVSAPPAAERPAAIGTDPLVLHFDMYLAAVGIGESVWTAGSGYEKVGTPPGTQGQFLEAVIGTDPAVLNNRRTPPGSAVLLADGAMVPAFTETPIGTVTVGGREATLYSVTNGQLTDSMWPANRTGATGYLQMGDGPGFVLRWQPADGVYALVETLGYDRSLIDKVAGALRLDRSQRCATPLRFTRPAAGTLTECRTSIRSTPDGTAGVWLNSSFEYAMPGGTTARVWTERKPQRVAHDLNQFVPNRTINGAKAQWRTADPAGLWLLSYGPAPAEVFISGLGEAESIALVQGMTFGADLADVGTWPAGPTG